MSNVEPRYSIRLRATFPDDGNFFTLLTLQFELPPFSEQKRIIAKVEKLLNLCNVIEEQLTRARQKSERLRPAVVQEVVGGK